MSGSSKRLVHYLTDAYFTKLFRIFINHALDTSTASSLTPKRSRPRNAVRLFHASGHFSWLNCDWTNVSRTIFIFVFREMNTYGTGFHYGLLQQVLWSPWRRTPCMLSPDVGVRQRLGFSSLMWMSRIRDRVRLWLFCSSSQSASGSCSLFIVRHPSDGWMGLSLNVGWYPQRF